MGEARESFGVGSIGARVYAIGGWRVDDARSAEALDMREKRWSLLPPMPTNRNSFQVVAFGGDLYAIGGIETKLTSYVEGKTRKKEGKEIVRNVGKPTDVVEIFDIRKNAWR